MFWIRFFCPARYVIAHLSKRATLFVIRNPLNDLNGVWFDRLTMHGLFSAHPELVEGLNGLNVLSVQSFADMPKKAQWRKNLAAAR
jgi:hypothetical protein